MTADDELRRLAEAATPGPWERASTDGMGWAVHRGEHDTVALYADRHDSEFIAAANPTAVLDLLDRLRAAEVLAEHASDMSDEQCIDGKWVHGVCCDCGEFVPFDAVNDHIAAAQTAALSAHLAERDAARDRETRAEALSVAAGLLRVVVDYWDGRPVRGHGEHIYADLRDALRVIERDAEHNRAASEGGDR